MKYAIVIAAGVADEPIAALEGRTPLEAAETLKKKYGCALPHLVHDEDTMEVPSVGGRKPRTLARKVLTSIIEPRVEEIFEHVRRELLKSGFVDNMAAGVVLTGGCTSLEGLPELAESVLELPARRGSPKDIGGLVDVVSSPKYSTGVGLVLYGAYAAHNQRPSTATSDRNVWRRMRGWFGEMF